jgi:hypothetical protein
MQHSSRLRYVDADEVGGEVIDFDGLKVRTPGGDKLGEVDGFIVDRDVRRAYYVVVDSGGWFTSRQFLVPIGHARIDENGDALVLDVTKETISGYPEYDRDSFERFDEEETQRYQARFADVCCPGDVQAHDHFSQPDWWRADYYNWDAPSTAGAVGVVPPRGSDFEARPIATSGSSSRDIRNATEGGDQSPHLGGRAQPGDVLGLETGGERTGLGDTAEKEDDRRRDAERAVGKEIRDEARDRKKN